MLSSPPADEVSILKFNLITEDETKTVSIHRMYGLSGHVNREFSSKLSVLVAYCHNLPFNYYGNDNCKVTRPFLNKASPLLFPFTDLSCVNIMATEPMDYDICHLQNQNYIFFNPLYRCCLKRFYLQ
jgi:hypothetical protein